MKSGNHPTLQLLARSRNLAAWAAGVDVFKDAELLEEVRRGNTPKEPGLVTVNLVFFTPLRGTHDFLECAFSGVKPPEILPFTAVGRYIRES